MIAPLPPAGQPREAPALPFQPGMKRPLTDEQLAAWQARIERAETKAKEFHPGWKASLERYAKIKGNPEGSHEVSALLDFRHVESKKAQLFHRTPDVNLAPVDPEDAAVPYIQILPLRQKLLNYELGRKGANAKRAMHKTLIDALAASGWLICKVGFEQASLPAGPDPQTGLAPTHADGTPVEVPIWSRRFITAVSSMKLLVPDDFDDSSDYDAAPWLAVKGTVPVSKAKRQKWYLPDDFTGSTAADEARFDHGLSRPDASDPQVEYTEIWYRASQFDEAVFHPELYRCLILVKGCEHAAWHIDSPFQTLTPEGQLTDDSMIGNPIHVGTLRDVTDSSYVPSDLVVGDVLSKELDRFRTGQARRRHSSRDVLLVATGLGKDVIKKIADNEGPVPVPDDYIDGAGNQRAAALIQKASEPRDNYTAQQAIEGDYEQALGIGGNQAGQPTKTKRTATEARIVQGNSSARADTEKDRVRDYAVALFAKFDVVVQRTATQQELQKVLGMQGAGLWQQWQQLPGKYAYEIQPDAGMYVDAQQYRAQKLNEYELLRKDPLINAAELNRGVVRALGYDPAKLVPKDAVDKTPEPPKMNLTWAAVDILDPVLGRVFLDIAAQSGYQFSPDTIAMIKARHELANEVVAAQGMAGGPPVGEGTPAEHGGMADKTEHLNKHQQQKTGGITGVGVM